MKIRCCLNLIYRYQSTSSALSRNRLTNDEIRAHRLRIFNNERQIQMERIRRVEKIEVDIQDPIQSTKLLKNLDSNDFESFSCPRSDVCFSNIVYTLFI